MINRVRNLILAFSLLLTSCPQPNTPPILTGDACKDACNAWAEFAKQDESCKKEANPTPAGKTCEQVCKEVESTGYTTMYPQCIVKAKNCQEAKKFSSFGCN